MTVLGRLLSSLLLCSCLAAQDSAAERLFRLWLEAFNSGDRARIGEFLKAHHPKGLERLENLLDFRERTGGFELKKIESSTAVRLTGIVKERDGDNYARFELDADPQRPDTIGKLVINVIPPPPEFPATERLSESEAIQALKKELDKQCAAGRFSGAVLVARGSKILHSSACGLADREKTVPCTEQTRFRIGSMNKMFTAVAVLQLVQSGKIRLDDPVGKHLRDYPNRDVAQKVTVHHLLTHTGGTGDIFGPQFREKRKELRDIQDYIKLYGSRGLEFEPGSKWAYSNYGFLLLGAIIEAVTGRSYYDYVRDRVFKPAGMNATDSLPEDQAVPGRATGYIRAPGGGLKPNTDTLPYRGTSAGGGYSTTRDMLRFARALLGHKLLDPKHTQLLISGKVDTPGGGQYAYGFGVGTEGGARWFGHGGGAPGMNGSLKVFPDSGYVVVALANLDPPAAGRIADFISRRLPLKP